ncbi:MAG: hypothetical protein ABI488_14845 [Polyangiaceae bacterium]
MLALSLASRTLFAQSGEDRASAQALFDDGRALVQANRAAEACPKFEESQRLDPGTGTLLNLAGCYEKVGRYASAWALYVEAMAASRSAGRADREALAKTHSEALLPRLSKLSVDVPVPAQVAGLSVTRDGQPVRQAQWGTALPIDPGKHQLTASAPGKKPWQVEIEISKPGRTETISVPVLADAPGEPGAGKPAAPLTDVQNATAVRRAKLRTASYVVGGLGVVAGFGLGTYFGLSALSKNNAAKASCDGNNCWGEGYTERNEARDAGTLSTIAFVAGGALVATGVVLFLVSSPNKEPNPEALHASAGAGPGGAWLSIGGSL